MPKSSPPQLFLENCLQKMMQRMPVSHPLAKWLSHNLILYSWNHGKLHYGKAAPQYGKRDRAAQVGGTVLSSRLESSEEVLLVSQLSSPGTKSKLLQPLCHIRIVLMTLGRKHQATRSLDLLRNARGRQEMHMSYPDWMKDLLQQHHSFPLSSPARSALFSPHH